MLEALRVEGPGTAGPVFVVFCRFPKMCCQGGPEEGLTGLGGNSNENKNHVQATFLAVPMIRIIGVSGPCWSLPI